MDIFKCKTCEAHLAHINALQHQIQTLETMVFPKKRTQDLSLEETDVLFDPDTKTITPDDPITAEAGLFLSGDYDRNEEF